MKRLFHHYNKWEEIPAGMWRAVSPTERDVLLKKAIVFTGDAKLYGSFMMRVVMEWPVSCEQNLSNQSINRRAWIGHAACCLALSCPEDITREAWHHLTQQQQDDANERASLAIARWETNHVKKEEDRAKKKDGRRRVDSCSPAD